MYTNIIVKIEPQTPIPKNPVNLVNPVQNSCSTTRLKIEPDPNRPEPPFQINAPERTEIEPKPDQKRTEPGSKVEKSLQLPANPRSQNSKTQNSGEPSEPTTMIAAR